MKTLALVVSLVAILQAEKKPDPTFERIKMLEGKWEGTGEGKPVSLTYKVTGEKSAVMESIALPDGEMITMYHRDGDGLMLTHYCALGNQPRMKSEKTSSANAVRFVCAGGTNFTCAKDPHMHALTMTFVDKDKLKHEWSMYEGGKEKMVVTFDLARK